MEAQRACLDAAATLITEEAVAGPVLELGLGNGRTYDHLRERLPDREIFVFERKVAAHPDCVPDDAHLFLGAIDETLPQAERRLGRSAALAHSDLGTGDAAANAVLARLIGPALARLVRPGGVIVSDQALDVAGWSDLPLPAGVRPGRYHLYRAV